MTVCRRLLDVRSTNGVPPLSDGDGDSIYLLLWVSPSGGELKLFTDVILNDDKIMAAESCVGVSSGERGDKKFYDLAGIFFFKSH